jgi:hypothetical protein
MKTRALHQSTSIGWAVVIAALAPGLASADNFVGTDFQAAAATAHGTPAFDYAAHGYRKLNLSVIGNIAWVPTDQGAQGPVRESMDSGAAMLQDTDRRFYPVGGHNTP